MQHKLPAYSQIAVQNLARVFSNTTNSYKFYWFIGLLAFIKRGEAKVGIDEVVVEMITKVWYPIIFFKLSFGKQDQLVPLILQIKEDFQIADDVEVDTLRGILQANSQDPRLINVFRTLSRYVPTRFISPWFDQDIRGMDDHKKPKRIIQLAEIRRNSIGPEVPIYSISNSTQPQVVINETWFGYLQKNIAIVEGFVYWELLNYLYAKNPNVPNIASKLEPPKKRNLALANKFWRNYLKSKGELTCIYSSFKISPLELSIDHFLPWSYVSHDLLWNLVPTSKVVNSSKSNVLPAKIYKDPFAEMQFQAFDFWIDASNAGKILEDYVLLFNADLREISSFGKTFFKQKLWENIEPQLQIATNMGFATNWKYNNDLPL